MEPLSEPLRQVLDELRLCSPRDLRRCRGRVRKLARDLPAFDSVWVDALVQAGRLTPFQARVLEDAPTKLAVGPWVIVDRIGHGSDAETFLAVQRGGTQQVALKRIRCLPEAREQLLANLKELATRLERRSLSGAVGPHAALVDGDTLVTISQFVAGPNLRELLTRRGRFAAAVVEATARQLVDTLAALEAVSVIHGDVCMNNLRLTTAGKAVLVDTGLRPAWQPELSVPGTTDPDRFDGVAPELIGTGRSPDTASEFYALGCLCWHLLAGRPPFPTGDPLAKLVAHRTQRVPDIRHVAPDTPDRLAQVILAWTDPDPTQRPPSFRAFRERWGSARHRDHRTLRTFRAGFNTTVRRPPRPRPEEPTSRFATAAALLFLLSGAALTLVDAGTRNVLLSLPERWLRQVTDSEPAAAAASPTASEQSLPALPAPDENGIVELPNAGPFAASSVDAVGPLTIRASGPRPAVIIVQDSTWQLNATDVTLEHVAIRAESSSPAALLDVRAQTLTVRRCRWTIPESSSGLRWQPVESRGPALTVVLEDCVFESGRSAVQLASRPGSLRCANCLRVGGESLIELRSEAADRRELRLVMDSTTLRSTSALLDWATSDDRQAGTVVLSLTNSILDLTGEAAVVRLRSQHPTADAALLVLEGADSLLSAGIPIAVARPAEGAWQVLDDSRIPVEGLAVGIFEFAGPPTDGAVAAQLVGWQGPRRSSATPGVDVERLPAP